MTAHKKGLRRWLWDIRTSSRIAFLLQLSRQLVSGLCSMVTLRLLIDAMGKPVYAVYANYSGIFSLGGLGDLGMGGAVGIRTGQYLGEGKEKELQRFLASARGVFLLLALVAGLGMLVLTPWLPQWLIGSEVEGTGSLNLAFIIGVPMIVGLISNSYISNLNYACGNVAWPIVPSFVLLQLNLVATWLLARQHLPLWIVFIPSVCSSTAEFCLWRYYVRLSHPTLASLLPVKFDRRVALTLLESSGWMYLCALGNRIYRTTDNLMINKNPTWSATGMATDYACNYKFCELAVFVVLSASFVIMPKITRWMASSDPKDQAKVRLEMRRLNQFQSLLGCGAALAYIGGNDLFIHIWYLKAEHPVIPVTLAIQLAFALNLVVTTSGDTAIQLATRTGKGGLRLAGLAIGLTGALNFGLSAVAMKRDSLLGIAMATVLAQSILSLVTSGYLCRHLGIGWWSWAFKSWVLPVIAILVATWVRLEWPLNTWAHAFGMAAAFGAILLVIAVALGVTPALLREELNIVVKSFRK